MHAFTLVEVPAGTTIETAEAAVEPLLAPHREDISEDDELVGFWDYWLIGGRYTGRIDGYNPTADPVNQERCPFCNGTGTRTDGMFGRGGCNGCAGTGVRTKWNLAPHAGDIAQRGSLGDDARPYTLVTAAKVTHEENYSHREFTPSEEHATHWRDLDPDTWLVVVDCHS